MIRRAEAGDMDAVRGLFREYAASVGPCGCFCAFETDVEQLPAGYDFILIKEADACVAVRRLANDIAEMKRLYVAPRAQGHGVGRALAEAAIRGARDLGCRLLRLDTLPSMARAIALYQALGFHEIPPYGGNPAGAICFELLL